MARFTALLGAAVTLLGSGCVVTHEVRRPSKVAERVVRATGDAAGADDVAPDGRKITVLYSDPSPEGVAPTSRAGTVHRAPLESFSSKNISVTTSDGPKPLELQSVRGYEVRRSTIGAVGGGITGLLIGAAVGGALGYSRGDDPRPMYPPCDKLLECPIHIDELVPRFSAADKVAFGAVVGGLSSVVIGALVGRLIGPTDRFIF